MKLIVELHQLKYVIFVVVVVVEKALSRGHPWCSGSALDYWLTGRVIDLAPGA